MKIEKGTWVLAGHATISIDSVIPDQGDAVTGFALSIEPEFGYFVADGCLVLGSFQIGAQGGELYEDSPITGGFMIGIRFIFGINTSIHPFLGAGLGIGFIVPPHGDTTTMLAVRIQCGLLFALNRHLAIEVGVRIQIDHVVESGGGTLVRVPIGMIGLTGTI